MLSFIARAAFSGVMVAPIATVARRYSGWGGLLASLPLFLLLPWMLRGSPFWPSFAASIAITLALYALTLWIAARRGWAR